MAYGKKKIEEKESGEGDMISSVHHTILSTQIKASVFKSRTLRVQQRVNS